MMNMKTPQNNYQREGEQFKFRNNQCSIMKSVLMKHATKQINCFLLLQIITLTEIYRQKNMFLFYTSRYFCSQKIFVNGAMCNINTCLTIFIVKDIHGKHVRLAWTHPHVGRISLFNCIYWTINISTSNKGTNWLSKSITVVSKSIHSYYKP